MKLSLVIPCYNEEAVLPRLFARLDAVATSLGCDWEAICVNDGSKDATWSLLVARSQADTRWRALCLSRNFGHQAAVGAGLFHATGDAVVIIDADLQDPPEVIADLLQRWREGNQVVHAVRKNRQDPQLKRILAWSFYRLFARLVPFRVSADSGDFCLLDRAVVDLINALPERNRFLRGLRAWCGFQQATVEFERQARAAGTPQYTFGKSLRLALDGLFSFSTVPLKVATYLGFAISGLALFGSIFTLCQKLFARQFATIGLAPGPGFPTIVISILFLGGIQLICLGIIGEYLARIYDEVKDRPAWIVRSAAGFPVFSRTPTAAPQPRL